MIATRERARHLEAVDAEFRAFIADPRFSCLAGKGVVRSSGYALAVYGALGSARSAGLLARDLDRYLAVSPVDATALRAFVAVFTRRPPMDEMAFERRMWAALQRLHERDDPGSGWDPTASSDPADPNFAFSFAGRALFVIGLNIDSLRLARRFRWPALVFNPHAQFDRLRADGRFEPLRAAVRERELALQGSLNPNLADFGVESEARQYSGRPTESDWRCPFHHRDA